MRYAERHSRSILAWALVVTGIVGACSSEGSAPSVAEMADGDHVAALGDCGKTVVAAPGGREGLDDAFDRCDSVELFVAATALRPGLFAEPLEAIDYAMTRCAGGGAVGSSLLCRSDSLVPQTMPPYVDPGPGVAIDPHYQAYVEELAAEKERAERRAARAAERARKAAAEAARKRRAEERAQAAAQRARTAQRKVRRTLSGYEASARNTYARVEDAVSDMYAANMAVEGLTREERQARHAVMDRYRLPAVRALRGHLSHMRGNPVNTCPGDLYGVDRELAQRWLGLLVRGNYPSTLSGGGRSIKFEFDAARKRTNTFLRNLAVRVARCR